MPVRMSNVVDKEEPHIFPRIRMPMWCHNVASAILPDGLLFPARSVFPR